MTRASIMTMASTRLLTSLIATALFLPWFTVPTLQAQFECTAKNTAGRYAFTKSGQEFGTTTSQFSVPGPCGAIGLITFEADGTVSKLIDIRMNLDGPNQLNPVDLAQLFAITSTVDSDCRTTMIATHREFGVVVFQFEGVFANGGQEGWTLQTFPPTDRLDLTTFKRIDPIVDQKLRSKMNRMGSRLGIFPRDDDD